MIKKYLFFFLIFFVYNTHLYSATSKSDTTVGTKSSSGGPDDTSFLNAKTSNFKKGLDALNRGNKFERKGKIKKSKKYFNKAINYFTLQNKELPNDFETVFYLGFTFEKYEDLIMAEIYYLQAIEIEPENTDIKKSLGLLYLKTDKMIEAQKILKSLKSCNCVEFKELRSAIKTGS